MMDLCDDICMDPYYQIVIRVLMCGRSCEEAGASCAADASASASTDVERVVWEGVGGL